MMGSMEGHPLPLYETHGSIENQQMQETNKKQEGNCQSHLLFT